MSTYNVETREEVLSKWASTIGVQEVVVQGQALTNRLS